LHKAAPRSGGAQAGARGEGEVLAVEEVEEVDIATRFELISEADNLLTRRSTMFAARFASSYNQSFPNNDGKSATINREIEL
jgi:hypothetical protein